MAKHPLLENKLYAIAIAIKAFDGAVQLAVGIVIFILGPQYVNTHVSDIITRLAKRELIGDRMFGPNILGWAANLSPNSTTFAAIYLIAHGIIKLLLVGALWSHKSWGPPVAATFLSIILVYEIERIYTHHSILLSCAALLDFAIITLIFREFRAERKAPDQRPLPQ